jgi:hypothetical protein
MSRLVGKIAVVEGSVRFALERGERQVGVLLA